jgi:hypothetical protein
MKRMKPLALDRLFALARTAPPADVPDMPPYLHTRVLAGWRRNPPGETGFLLTPLLRRALACAAALMLASIAWSYSAEDPEDEMTAADFDVRTSLLP